MPIVSLIGTEYYQLAALRSFLMDVLPGGTPVIRAQANRVPQPAQADFVLMTPILRKRMSFNRASWSDAYADCKFTGSIAGNVMTVTYISYGRIVLNAPVYGVGVNAGTKVIAFKSGTGYYGTYQISPSPQTIPAGTTMACGVVSITESTELTVQLDVHGPNAADNAQVMTTLLRSPYATYFFDYGGYPVQTLYADEAKQVPFINAEDEYEYRWVIDSYLQANPTVQVGQQYFDRVTIKTILADSKLAPDNLLGVGIESTGLDIFGQPITRNVPTGLSIATNDPGAVSVVDEGNKS